MDSSEYEELNRTVTEFAAAELRFADAGRALREHAAAAQQAREQQPEQHEQQDEPPAASGAKRRRDGAAAAALEQQQEEKKEQPEEPPAASGSKRRRDGAAAAAPEQQEQPAQQRQAEAAKHDGDGGGYSSCLQGPEGEPAVSLETPEVKVSVQHRVLWSPRRRSVAECVATDSVVVVCCPPCVVWSNPAVSCPPVQLFRESPPAENCKYMYVVYLRVYAGRSPVTFLAQLRDLRKTIPEGIEMANLSLEVRSNDGAAGEAEVD